MTSPNAMTREELLESAALDAFGLLDEYEAALYTRSFHHAPAAVQNEIIQLQATLVSDESLLPTENPDPTLRQRVLEAVTTAIEQETAQLEPLATIGRHRAGEGVIASTAWQPVQFWRAAAFALAAGLILMTYFMADLVQRQNQIAVIALTNLTNEQLERMIGPTFRDYVFDATSQRTNFRLVAAVAGTDPKPQAVLYTTEGSDLGFLIVDGLVPVAQKYTLTATIDGKKQAIHSFESTGRLGGVQVALNRVAGELRNVTWEIIGPTGAVLLVSV
jgi:hypothetical protein